MVIYYLLLFSFIDLIVQHCGQPSCFIRCFINKVGVGEKEQVNTTNLKLNSEKSYLCSIVLNMRKHTEVLLTAYHTTLVWWFIWCCVTENQ